MIFVRILFRLCVLIGGVLLASYLVPGITLDNWDAPLKVALVLAILNIFIKPLALVITLPVNVITLGLFTLVINAALFWTAGRLVDGFNLSGFWPAFAGGIVISVVSLSLNWLARPSR